MNPRRCFKCQELGHIASNCPNQKVITLTEWETLKEDDLEGKKEEGEENQEESEENQDEVIKEADDSEMLVLRGH